MCGWEPSVSKTFLASSLLLDPSLDFSSLILKGRFVSGEGVEVLVRLILYADAFHKLRKTILKPYVVANLSSWEVKARKWRDGG